MGSVRPTIVVRRVVSRRNFRLITGEQTIGAASMNLSHETQVIAPRVRRSPLSGFEYVHGYGVFGAPFESGHVLALRVFPENDFAPYKTIWHRTPDGAWSIFVDAPRHDIACPRYFGAAASLVQSASIGITWTGPAELRVEMDTPMFTWNLSMTSSPILGLMNTVNPRFPEGIRRARGMLRAMESMADRVLGLGRVTLAGITPNGHRTMLLPERMFFLASSQAEFDGVDLGRPARGGACPTIGAMKLPSRPVFAIGRAYFELRDPIEYERTIRELAEHHRAVVS
jgi:hypothetical protein